MLTLQRSPRILCADVLDQVNFQKDPTLADLRPRMDLEPGEEAGGVVDEAGDEEHVRFEEPVRHAVPEHRPQARIEQDFPARARCGIARHDGVEIGGQSSEHGPVFSH